MKNLPLKALLSSLLLLIFLFLAISGALLYFGKTGMVLGIPRYILRTAHTRAAAGMCVFLAAHIFINRRLYGNELAALIKSKRDKTPKAR